MAYQGVEYNELCLERKNTRKEASSINRKEKEKHQKKTARSLKLRRNEKELEREDDKPTPVIEDHNSEDDSDELLDVQL